MIIDGITYNRYNSNNLHTCNAPMFKIIDEEDRLSKLWQWRADEKIDETVWIKYGKIKVIK